MCVCVGGKGGGGKGARETRGLCLPLSPSFSSASLASEGDERLADEKEGDEKEGDGKEGDGKEGDERQEGGRGQRRGIGAGARVWTARPSLPGASHGL